MEQKPRRGRKYKARRCFRCKQVLSNERKDKACKKCRTELARIRRARKKLEAAISSVDKKAALGFFKSASQSL